MRIIMTGAFAALGLSAVPAAATNLKGTFHAAYNTKDPGLVVDAPPSSGALNFSLEPSESEKIDLFDIYTPDTTVNAGEDTMSKPISVLFSFSQPSPGFEGVVAGATQGNLQLFGLLQNGSVTWDITAIRLSTLGTAASLTYILTMRRLIRASSA